MPLVCLRTVTFDVPNKGHVDSEMVSSPILGAHRRPSSERQTNLRPASTARLSSTVRQAFLFKCRTSRRAHCTQAVPGTTISFHPFRSIRDPYRQATMVQLPEIWHVSLAFKYWGDMLYMFLKSKYCRSASLIVS
jgi:hypothetical protein